MKFRVVAILFAMISMMLLFGGCEPAEEEPVVLEPEPPSGIPSAIVRDRTYFVIGEVNPETNVITESDYRYLDLAEVVDYLEETAIYINSNGVELDFARIRLEEGTEGYVYAPYLAVDATPGVLTSEARVFSEGEDAGVTTRHLPDRQIVAVYPEEYEDNLVRVAFTPLRPDNDYEQNRVYTVWVKRIRITDDPDDVKVAYLYYLATVAEDEATKIARLEIATETPSVFTEMIQEEIDELSGVEEEDVPDVDVTDSGEGETYGPIPEDYEITTDVEFTKAVVNTRSNLRAEPNRESQSLLLLEAGVVVSVGARTVEQETIQGLTDHWYVVEINPGRSDATEGWIFGALLTPQGP
jgi:hypothetical protein